MDPLALLTEDCWKELLKRVKDPKDLKSCSDACLLFEEILRKRRSEFMFSLVLPHILKCLSAQPPDPPHRDFPRPWNTLLNGRLVCKSWRESIDNLRDAEDEYAFVHVYRFNSGELIDRFLQKFETHPENPFLGRRATLYLHAQLLLAGNQDEALNAEGDGQALMEMDRASRQIYMDNFHVRKLRQLLERFGKEIWIVELVDWAIYGHLEFCKNIQTILGHLEELRTLELRFGHINDQDSEVVDVDQRQRENLAEMFSYLEANPLPELPHLEHLQSYGDNRMMMRSLLEKYAHNLKSLVLGDLVGFPDQEFWMPNLEELKMDRLEATKSLRALRQLQAPQLRVLSLLVTENRNGLTVWPIDELFRNIQHLPIQRLAICSLPPVLVKESGPIPAEQRPSHGSISSIDLKFRSGTESFNSFIYCPKLRSISITRISQPWQVTSPGVPVPELLDVRELIGQDCSDLYRLYQSNIWEMIPSLESFRNSFSESFMDNPTNWTDYTRVVYAKRKFGNGGEAVEEQ